MSDIELRRAPALKIFVIGNGGREHAIIWKLSQSPKKVELYAAPGNAGTSGLANNLDIRATDVDALVKAARDNSIDFTVVGPEAPLAEGLVDRFKQQGLAVFGPSRDAAEIETSKVFSKSLMLKYGIPCAMSASFDSHEKAVQYARGLKPPVVIKADGLAAGKGVIIAPSTEEAVGALDDIMKEKKLGSAGDSVIIEEFLAGREVSTLAFTDSRSIAMMVPACDYKRIYDEDKGPNTGGMGCYSPPSFYHEDLNRAVINNIMKPAVEALEREGRPYSGVLYGGLMLTDSGIKALEFNARFGDPETQVILPRLKTDLVDIMEAVIEQRLDRINIEWHDEACVGVVMASGGYPNSYDTGFPISGTKDVDSDVMVFHAGTAIGAHGEVLTAGGRVLCVAAMGGSIAEARKKVYANIPRISFKNSYYRTDIADLKGE